MPRTPRQSRATPPTAALTVIPDAIGPGKLSLVSSFLRRSRRPGLSGILALELSIGLLLAAPPVHACGITTHVEVSWRAQARFDAIAQPDYASTIQAYPEALQGGASFPDWGYALPDYGDAAEEAHWDPFLRAAADYVYRNYPPPWTPETRRLVVFLFAVSAHSVADISWHGLGVQEGFIDVLSAQDYRGDWGAAHTGADTGGDMVGARELDQTYMLKHWYVPTDDMVALYHELGYLNVTAEAVTLGNFLIFLGGQAERIAGQLLYPYFASDSPLLTDLYQDYFAGGVDDMSQFSAWKWLEMIDWIENGAPGSRLSIGPDHEHLSSHDLAIQVGLDLLERGELAVTVERTARGIIFHAHAPDDPDSSEPGPLASVPGEACLADERAAPPWSRDADFRDAGLTSAPPSRPTVRRVTRGIPVQRAAAVDSSIVTSTPYSHLGTSLAVGDWDRDGLPDLAVGAPGYGGAGSGQQGLVGIYSGTDAWWQSSRTDLSADASRLLTREEESSRFGWSLATLDFNADGTDDLAIGAPTLGASELRYTGEVFLYFGHPASGLPLKPDIILTSAQTYDNLGHVLKSGDADGDGFDDLLVGMPYARAPGTQQGSASIFLSSSARRTGQVLPVASPDWSVAGEAAWDWFGAQVAVARLLNGSRLWLVSAPAVNSGDLQSVGRLYAFDLSGIGSGTGPTAPVFTLTGTREFDQLGAQLVQGDPYGTETSILALAAPTRGDRGLIQSGAVFLLRLDELVGALNLEQVPALTTLVGSEDYARFGSSLLLADTSGDGQDDLFVASSHAKSSAGAEGGFVFGWTGGSIPLGMTLQAERTATLTLEGLEAAARLGSSLLAADLDSNGLADLVVASRQSAAGARLSGRVDLFLTSTPARGSRPARRAASSR